MSLKAFDKLRIVIASINPGKYREVMDIMSDLPVEWIPGNAFGLDVDETGSTYRENAVLKAVAFARAAGCPALADDSGLEVDALNGLPGVRSNRMFGTEGGSDSEKIAGLLEKLKDVPESKRTARFVCHAVLVSENSVLHYSSGVIQGIIIDTPRGRDGFGYDPVFFLPEYSKTFAQLPRNEKNKISHRGRAMRDMRNFLLRSYL